MNSNNQINKIAQLMEDPEQNTITETITNQTLLHAAQKILHRFLNDNWSGQAGTELAYEEKYIKLKNDAEKIYNAIKNRKHQ